MRGAENLIFSLRSLRRFSSALALHFTEPAVDSRRILRVDVTRKESFQMEPFSLSLSLYLSLFCPFLTPRGPPGFSSFPIWPQPFGRCRYRPSPTPYSSLAARARDIDCSFPLAAYASLVSDATYFQGVAFAFDPRAVPFIIPLC